MRKMLLLMLALIMAGAGLGLLLLSPLLLATAASTPDATVQCTSYQKAQQMVYDAATAVNLFSVPWPLGYSTRLTGVVVSPTVTPISLATVRLK